MNIKIFFKLIEFLKLLDDFKLLIFESYLKDKNKYDEIINRLKDLVS
jgi:hypothetical protein